MQFSQNDKIRESLHVEWENDIKRPEKIIAIGINPSTACDGESDTTMTKLCRFLDMYGFNNVSMLNLYESVSPEQIKINKATKTDFEKKRSVLDEADIVLLVWGVEGHLEGKNDAAIVLNDYSEKLYCIKNQNGRYPAHPSRMSYKSELVAIKSKKDYEECGLVRKKTSIRIEGEDMESNDIKSKDIKSKDIKSKDIESKDTEECAIIECDLGVYMNNKFVMSLGAGTDAVIRFSELADAGISGEIDTVRSFSCNRDVAIGGKDLLKFIQAEYPNYYERATSVILDTNELYKIICYDMS